MEHWQNIVVPSDDPEIKLINEFKDSLLPLPDPCQKIRELITRFEVCHFKYKKHTEMIRTSIENLYLGLSLSDIGRTHIRSGEGAWKEDVTGRSAPGQQYLWAIMDWLGDEMGSRDRKLTGNNEIDQQRILQWLGKRSEDKDRLVRLLVSRLTWNWKSLEELQRGGWSEKLEQQIIRMDICHYAFPENMDVLLKGIGKLEAVEGFEGCGSFNDEIQERIKEELHSLHDLLHSYKGSKQVEDRYRTWLLVSFMKTIKEQAGLSEPSIDPH